VAWLQEVRLRRPSRVTVVGHSLGGGQAILIAFHLARRFPSLSAEAVSYAGMTVGDPVFADQLAATVNTRQLVFLGKGAEGSTEMYTVGDIIPQYTCGPFPGCPKIGTGEEGEKFDYKRAPNQVVFYAEDMPNPNRWLMMSNIYLSDAIVPSIKSTIANHICSYLCWTAKGLGDPEDRCFFPADDKTIPMQYLCDMPEILL
jgi:pimeloyl-ACP methyl ester carboxylesterase